MAEKTATKKKKGKYIYAVGRRKSATAKVRLYPGGEGKFVINGRPMDDYFTTLEQTNTVLQPLNLLNLMKEVDIEVETSGGGLAGQADAVSLGITRALVEEDEDRRVTLKKHGLLTRDARVKERKKPGLKGARRAPQWQKR